jgi:hypothetical protein
MKYPNQPELLPPWKKYPEIHRFSIGWRMGYGEDYMIEWIEYYSKLSEEKKETYKRKFPTPIMWLGFYNRS